MWGNEPAAIVVIEPQLNNKMALYFACADDVNRFALVALDPDHQGR